jgi:general secretion pathway protein G
LVVGSSFISNYFKEGRQMKKANGFTLIEILIVVIIIGILASLVVPRLAGRTEEARRQAARSDIEGGIALALDLYEADAGKYPGSLEDLVRKPSDARKWRGPYLKKGKVPKDPWSKAYIYRVPGTQNDGSYDLFSAGFDGQEGTADDVTNWEDESDATAENDPAAAGSSNQ